MTPRRLIILAVVALVTASAAVAVWRDAHWRQTLPDIGDRLLPSLLERINAVAAIQIIAGGRELALLRDGGGVWRLRDSGYPLSSSDLPGLHETLITLARMEKLEPKTALTKNYPAIGVEGPGEANMQSRLLILRDDDGVEIASVILGDPAWGFAGLGQEAQYVRLTDHKQSWLVRGMVMATPVLEDWMDTALFNLSDSPITSVRFSAPEDQGTFEIRARSDGDDMNAGTAQADDDYAYGIVGLDPAMQTETADAAASAVTDISRLNFTAIRRIPADNATPIRIVRVSTAQGLTMKIFLFEDNGDYWVTLAASATAVADDRIRERVEKLNAKVGTWQFAISQDSARPYRKSLSDFAGSQTE